MASLYQRTLRSGTTSPVWWMKYSAAGRVIRQTTGTTDKRTAQRFLDSRVGRAAEGQPILPRADRVRYEEAAEDLRQHYATTGSRGTVEAGWRLAHLGAFFAGRRLVNLGPQDASAYVAHRQGQGASNATINRELAVLGRMLRLAVANNKLMRMPDFRDRKPKEAAPRAGFFEPEQYESVRRRLPADLQAACAIAYTYGWRMRSEVLTLRLSQLDLKAGTLRLEPGMTKNDDGRLRVPHPGARAAPGRPVGPRGGPGRQLEPARIIPYLFPHFTGTATRRPGTRGAVLGEQRTEFRKAWATACKGAGCPGMLRHDFRRTAARNLDRAGVPRSVAMKITGHRTEAVYRRYTITSDADQRDAAVRLGTFLGTPRGGALETRSVKA